MPKRFETFGILGVFALGTRLGLDLDFSKSSPSQVKTMGFSHYRVLVGLGSNLGSDSAKEISFRHFLGHLLFTSIIQTVHLPSLQTFPVVMA